MAMEVLGGNGPAGRPAAVVAGGSTHVFAIGSGGMINRWTSQNGVDWQGAGELIQANTNIVPSYPCAIAVGNVVNVSAINNDGSLGRCKGLTRAGGRRDGGLPHLHMAAKVDALRQPGAMIQAPTTTSWRSIHSTHLPRH